MIKVCLQKTNARVLNSKAEKLCFFRTMVKIKMRTQGVAQFGSVPVLGTGGRRFKSCHLDNFSFFHFLYLTT